MLIKIHRNVGRASAGSAWPPRQRGIHGTHPESSAAGQDTKTPESANKSPKRAVLRHRRSLMLWSLATLILLELVYLLLGNWYLNSDTLRRTVNRRPDHFRLNWESARTWFPGRFQIQGARLSGTGSKDQWYCEVDRCTFDVSLLALLRRRVSCSRFHGQGVDFRLRNPGNGDTAADWSHQPDLPEIEIPLGLEGWKPIDSKRENHAWRIEVKTVELDAIRQLWIRMFRLRGDGSVAGSVRFQTQGLFTAEVIQYWTRNTELQWKGQKLITELDSRVIGKLGPVDFDEAKGGKVYEYMDAELKATGSVNALPGSRTGSGIRLLEEGSIDADVRILRGFYQDGSSVKIAAPQLRVSLGPYSWVGKAVLSNRVDSTPSNAVARMEAQITDLQFWHRNRLVVGAKSPEIVLRSVSRDLQMTHLFSDADVYFQLSPMLIPDLSIMNEYIPEALGTRIVTGQIKAEAEIQGSPGEAVRGTLRLAGQQIGANIRGGDYLADVDLKARFTSVLGETSRFRIEGSSLELSQVHAHGMSERQEAGWYAALNLESGMLEVKAPWHVKADAKAEIRDTRPIMAVLRAQEGSPSWLKWLPTFKDLGATAHLDISMDEVKLDGLEVDGRGTEMRGHLYLLKQRATGLIYARYGLLSLALDLREASRDWRILAAKRWYERRLQDPQEKEPRNTEEPKP